MSKTQSFVIQRADGQYVTFTSKLKPGEECEWTPDLGLAWKYRLELIAGDIARRLGATVVAIEVPVAA
jgi:hypothetical protein